MCDGRTGPLVIRVVVTLRVVSLSYASGFRPSTLQTGIMVTRHKSSFSDEHCGHVYVRQTAPVSFRNNDSVCDDDNVSCWRLISATNRVVQFLDEILQEKKYCPCTSSHGAGQCKGNVLDFYQGGAGFEYRFCRYQIVRGFPQSFQSNISIVPDFGHDSPLPNPFQLIPYLSYHMTQYSLRTSKSN